MGNGFVPNAVEITCAGCGALYRMLTRRPDVTVLFRCVHCRQYSLFHLGHVLALDAQLMTTGPDDVRLDHIRQRMEDGVLDALADVRASLDQIINVNVDLNFAKRIYPPGLEPGPRRRKTDPTTSKADPAEGTPGPPDGQQVFRMLEGFEEATKAERPDARKGITDQEVEDFRKSLDDPDFWTRLGPS